MTQCIYRSQISKRLKGHTMHQVRQSNSWMPRASINIHAILPTPEVPHLYALVASSSYKEYKTTCLNPEMPTE